MVQESPTESDSTESSDAEAPEGESPDDPVVESVDERRGTTQGTDEVAADSGRDDASVEEAVDEAVSDAKDRTADARETVEETSEAAAERASETTDEVSEKTDELSGKTDELTDEAAVAVETPPDEAAALRRVKTVGTLLDDAVRIPGTSFRVGLDPILGIVPGGGDAVAAALSLYPIAEAYRLDAPPKLIAKMLSLIAVDFLVGSVPVVGTLFDAFWKANEWNARALERHLESV